MVSTLQHLMRSSGVHSLRDSVVYMAPEPYNQCSHCDFLPSSQKCQYECRWPGSSWWRGREFVWQKQAAANPASLSMWSTQRQRLCQLIMWFVQFDFSFKTLFVLFVQKYCFKWCISNNQCSVSWEYFKTQLIEIKWNKVWLEFIWIHTMPWRDCVNVNKAFKTPWFIAAVSVHGLSLYTHPHLAVFYFHSLGPVSPLRSPWVPVCPWRHGSRSPPLTGQRWTSQGWHSPPAGWHTPTPANEQTQPTDTSELFLKIFFFCQIVRLLSSYFIFSKPLWLFLTQSRRGLWGAGHLVAAKRWGLQEAPLWPRSRSPCATCPCLAGTRLINIH